jgi:3-mercaptopyruvate sulfurtransferase SseA
MEIKSISKSISINQKKINSIISPELLNDLISNTKNQTNIKLFDCTYPKERGFDLFKSIRIPNANFFDFDLFRSDQIIKSSQLSLGFPNLKQIKNFLNKFDIKNSDHIILYDQYGIHSSPRAWFLLDSYNIKNISILNGGLPLWMKNKFLIDTEYYEEDYINDNINEEDSDNDNEESDNNISKEVNKGKKILLLLLFSLSFLFFSFFNINFFREY